MGSNMKDQNYYSNEDIEQNKVLSGLAYALFFLPLLGCPDSPYGRFHANQGLLLLLLAAGSNVILPFIPVIGWIVLPFFDLAVVIFFIIGMLNGFNGKAKELPLIGKYRLIK